MGQIFCVCRHRVHPQRYLPDGILWNLFSLVLDGDLTKWHKVSLVNRQWYSIGCKIIPNICWWVWPDIPRNSHVLPLLRRVQSSECLTYRFPKETWEWRGKMIKEIISFDVFPSLQIFHLIDAVLTKGEIRGLEHLPFLHTLILQRINVSGFLYQFFQISSLDTLVLHEVVANGLLHLPSTCYTSHHIQYLDLSGTYASSSELQEIIRNASCLKTFIRIFYHPQSLLPIDSFGELSLHTFIGSIAHKDIWKQLTRMKDLRTCISAMRQLQQYDWNEMPSDVYLGALHCYTPTFDSAWVWNVRSSHYCRHTISVFPPVVYKNSQSQ